MGGASAIGLFLSAVVHELMHSLIARRYGLLMKGITLLIFGGVAKMEDEPPSPKAEFSLAVAGPVTSIVIAFIFYCLSVLTKEPSFPVAIHGVLRYLGFINGARSSYQQLIVRKALEGEKVSRFMKPDPITVPPELSIQELVEEYVYS